MENAMSIGLTGVDTVLEWVIDQPLPNRARD